MADVAKISDTSGGTSNGIQLAQLLLNASGTKNTSTTAATGSSGTNTSGSSVSVTQASDEANSNLSSLYSTASAKATDTATYDSLVANILQQSAQAFAPVLASGLGGSGLYNSSTVKLLQDNARAQAVSQSVSAVTSAQQSALSTAAQIAGTQASANKTTSTAESGKSSTATTTNNTVISAAKPGITDMITSALPGIALGVGAKATGLDKMAVNGIKSLTDSLGITTAADTGSGISATVGGGLGGTSATGTGIGVDALGNGIGSGASTGAISQAANELGQGLGVSYNAPEILSSSFDIGAPLLAEEGVVDLSGLIGAEIGTDVLSGIGIGAGAEVLGGAAAEGIGAEALGAGVAEMAGVFTGGEVAAGAAEMAGVFTGGEALATGAEVVSESMGLGEIVTAAVAAWVICTELNEQGTLADDLYAAGAQRSLQLPAKIIEGYHYWAIPYTRWMRRSKAASAFIRPFAVARNKHILGSWNFVGWLSVKLGEPLCGMIGSYVRWKQLRTTPWQSLYTAQHKD